MSCRDTAPTAGRESRRWSEMPTDIERREVARRLRAARGPSLMVLMGVLGVGGAHLFDRLADLIDPTCLACPDVEDTPDGGQFDCWSCSVCGNILYSDPDYDTDTDGPTYCEMCGHRTIGKGEPTWL